MKNFSRPVVIDYRSPIDFFYDLNHFYKNDSKYFSLRQSLSKTQSISSSLVSLLLSKKRKFKYEHLIAFKDIFQINEFEFSYLEKIIKHETQTKFKPNEIVYESKSTRKTQNHILKDWINVYIKDLCQLKNFNPNPRQIFLMLGGIVSIERIKKSIQFLLTEGFWKQDNKGKIVPNNNLLVTTNNIPSKKIKQFHKQALKIASNSIDNLPVERRFASTMLISVDKKSQKKLRELVEKFQHELIQFVEDNPNGNEILSQVCINLTPIGGENV